MNRLNIICVFLLITQGFNFNIVTGKSLALRKTSRATCVTDQSIEGEVGFCFICDSHCIGLLQASSYKENKDSFFHKLMEFVTAKFSFTKIKFFATRINYENFDRGREMRGYDHAAPPGQEVTETVKGFWSEDRRNYYKGAPMFCDASFLITDFVSKAGNSGAAFQSGICTDYSVGYLIVNDDPDNSFDLIGTTLAHEIGHLFGMSHDGYIMPEKYLDRFGQCKDTIQNKCPSSSGIMSPAVTAGLEFSDCSKAYYTYWAQQANKPNSRSYSRSCITKPVVGSGMAE